MVTCPAGNGYPLPSFLGSIPPFTLGGGVDGFPSNPACISSFSISGDSGFIGLAVLGLSKGFALVRLQASLEPCLNVLYLTVEPCTSALPSMPDIQVTESCSEQARQGMGFQRQTARSVTH